ncbi:trypsin-like peptidase domain-containing protein ['Fragaria x ananassa' phyllody phytoplasma]|uniref:Trypsin-like peptidase domain-containing protein n=1 Tax='Fragaria x ananassa' phyllody phytoplasma TaxID=2358428 RepID=A0ABS5K2R8_9MOLU|nr:serine protease ['Fragaria x ananassa' phyllody phytoplasma]MBS2126132.1 trypsin-like peptidase domain-containing protein ['Fragaria x ananassa' phyllody phytoplasma]
MKKVNYYKKFIIFFGISIVFGIGLIQLIIYPKNIYYKNNLMPANNQWQSLNKNDRKQITKEINIKSKQLEILKNKLKSDLQEKENIKSNQIRQNKNKLCQIKTLSQNQTLGIIILTDNNKYWIITPKNEEIPKNKIQIQVNNTYEIGQKETSKDLPQGLNKLSKDFEIISFSSKNKYPIIALDSQKGNQKYYQGQMLYSFVISPSGIIAFQESFISENINLTNQNISTNVQIPISSRNDSTNPQTVFFTENGNLLGFLTNAKNKNEKGIKYLKVILPTSFNNEIITKKTPQVETQNQQKSSHIETLIPELNTITLFINTGYNLGTGIIVKQEKILNQKKIKYYALTNRHVIESFYNAQNHPNKSKSIYVENEIIGETPAELYAFIGNKREYDDIAIITFTLNEGKEVKIINENIKKHVDFDEQNLKQEINIEQGETIYALGCQKGLQTQIQPFTFLDLYFQNKQKVQIQYKKNLFKQGIISYLNEKEINLDITLDAGNSGGPLFNASGKLIGINKSYYKYLRISQSININHVKQLFYHLLKLKQNKKEETKFKLSENIPQKIKQLQELSPAKTQIILKDLFKYLQDQHEHKIIFESSNRINQILTINLHGSESLQIVNCDFKTYHKLEFTVEEDPQSETFLLTFQLFHNQEETKPTYQETISIYPQDIEKIFLTFETKELSYESFLTKEKTNLEAKIALITQEENEKDPREKHQDQEEFIKKEMLQTVVLCQNIDNQKDPNLGIIINKKQLDNETPNFLYTVIFKQNNNQITDVIYNTFNNKVKITIQTPYGLQDEEGQYQNIAILFNPFVYINFTSDKEYLVTNLAQNNPILGETIYLISDCNDISKKALAPHIFHSHLANDIYHHSQEIMVDTTFLTGCLQEEASSTNSYYNNWFLFDSQGDLVNICSKQDIINYSIPEFPFIIFPKLNITFNKLLQINFVKVYIFIILSLLSFAIFLIIAYFNNQENKYRCLQQQLSLYN